MYGVRDENGRGRPFESGSRLVTMDRDHAFVSRVESLNNAIIEDSAEKRDKYMKRNTRRARNTIFGTVFV